MSSHLELLQELIGAADSLKSSLEIIIKNAPDLEVYDNLIQTMSNPLLKSVMDSAGIDLNDPSIKFAVQFKELYSKGHADNIVKLLNGENAKDIINYTYLNKSTNSVESESISIQNTNLKQDSQSELNFKDTNEISNLDPSEVIESIHHFDLSDYQNNNENSDGGYNGGDFPDNLHKRKREYEILTDDNISRPPIIHNEKLLQRIFTHHSIVNNLLENQIDKVRWSNERLEFLGDSLLQFVVTMIIYERFPNFNEGQLSILRSNIVSNKNLLSWAKMYKFDKCLAKNMSDNILIGDQKLFADVFEAYLGAICEQYMMESEDGILNIGEFTKGYLQSKIWIEKLAEQSISSYDAEFYYKLQYSKTAKQDIRLLIGNVNVPEYVRINLGNQNFLSAVKINNKIYGYGIGTSNKECDARAATDAMKNPLIKKICPSKDWEEFEKKFGLNDKGGLNLNGESSPVTKDQLEKLAVEIATKFKHGNIKFLPSKNNSEALFIDDNKRSQIQRDIDLKHNFSVADSKSIQHDIKEEDSDYYHSRVTRGRGGVFDQTEFKRVKKRSEKEIEGGILRNKKYQLEDGNIITCHEILVNSEVSDVDAKNKVNGIFNKRGGVTDYRYYKTAKGFYLAELWFGSDQIVAYGISTKKQDASRKAAQLAYMREEFFGYS